MIILNYKDEVNDEKFEFIYEEDLEEKIEEIKTTTNNSTLIFKFDVNIYEISKFCNENGIEFGIIVNDEKEFLISNALKAKYAFIKNDLEVKRYQKLADEYMMDMKVIVSIDDIDEIYNLIDTFVDGVYIKGELDA